MLFPRAALPLLEEIYDEERMLEVDEEVAHICLLHRLLWVRDDVDLPIHVSVLLVDLFLQLLLRQRVGNILHAEVGAKVFRLHHEVDLDRLITHTLAIVGVGTVVQGSFVGLLADRLVVMLRRLVLIKMVLRNLIVAVGLLAKRVQTVHILLGQASELDVLGAHHAW